MKEYRVVDKDGQVHYGPGPVRYTEADRLIADSVQGHRGPHRVEVREVGPWTPVEDKP